MTDTRTPLAMSSVERDAEIVRLQAELLDQHGDVRAGLTTKRRRALLTRINELRAASGWARLDMHGRVR